MKRKRWNVILLALITLLQFVVTEQALALTKPTLLSPGSNASITSPSVTFSWSHPYNDQYELKIKTSGGTLKYASGKMSSKSKTVNLSSIPLTYGSTYKWYVVVYALGQEDSSADRYFTYNFALPGSVSVNPTSGSWQSSPQNVSVSSSGASQIFCSVSVTTNGTTPADPPDPTASNSSCRQSSAVISGSSGSLEMWASSGQNKRYKVKFRGNNSSGYGPTSGIYSYSINITQPPPPTDDHGNSCSAATAVNVNSSTAGTINSAGDWDYFKVQVPSSGTLTVYTTGSTDTYGFLKNSSCADIASNDDYNGTNFRISQSVTAGTYYVAVRHYSSTGTGAYTLNVSFGASPPPPTDDHGNSCSAATAVNVNSSTAGTINSAGDWDYFKVQVPSSGTLTVYTTGSTDTYGFLYPSDCGAAGNFAYNDDDGEGLNFRIVRSVTAGTHYVAVRHYSSSGTGSYTLVSTFTSTNPFAAGTDAFVRAKTGLCTDMDGVYGCQCVDLMIAYIQDVLGVPRANHSIRGNAYPIYASITGSVTISYGTRMVRLDKIANTSTGVPQKGDIIFWGQAVGGGFGHVAIFLSGDANSFVSLDQNWVNFSLTSGSPATPVTHNYTNVVGWLRPVLLSN